MDLLEYPVLATATTDHPWSDNLAETRLHCRSGVAERLVAADGALPEGVRLLVLECHRPLEFQQHIWEENLALLKESHQDWSEERLLQENAKFVAPPWNVPPHSTGGAMDLVLADEDGRELDMGSEWNEEGPLMRTDADGISPEAKANRRMLLEAMRSAGFVNYPHEWWHFSYGDRYWAYATGQNVARYTSI
ncbi:MAG: M15 family metallopeptidase [Rubrobacteraceae bacterium]